jgi:hypothetical protein
MATTRILLKLEIVLDVEAVVPAFPTYGEVEAGFNQFLGENDLCSCVELKWETLDDLTERLKLT